MRNFTLSKSLYNLSIFLLFWDEENYYTRTL